MIGTNILLTFLPLKSKKSNSIGVHIMTRRLDFQVWIGPADIRNPTRLAITPGWPPNYAATMPKLACPGKWHPCFYMEKLFGEKSPFPIPATPDFSCLWIFLSFGSPAAFRRSTVMTFHDPVYDPVRPKWPV
ncbi:MAG: hypothetical protein IH994_02555 [Proteobacteria bacterium]|nr:hypothetical protein [Pseudomonadota bacterium]